MLGTSSPLAFDLTTLPDRPTSSSGQTLRHSSSGPQSPISISDGNISEDELDKETQSSTLLSSDEESPPVQNGLGGIQPHRPPVIPRPTRYQDVPLSGSVVDLSHVLLPTDQVAHLDDLLPQAGDQ